MLQPKAPPNGPRQSVVYEANKGGAINKRGPKGTPLDSVEKCLLSK